jgi:hypothetical protein
VGINLDGHSGDWDAFVKMSGAEWTELSAVVYDQGCGIRYPQADSAKNTDLGARVLTAYDDAYLFVAFLVEDDGHVPYSGKDLRFFYGDAPQVLLDVRLEEDYDDRTPSADDVQVDLRPTYPTPAAALWRLDPIGSRALTEARVAYSPTSTGYLVEAALPWKYLDVRPEPGTRLGFVASVSDNDTPDTDQQQCMISTAPERDWQDPTTWGTLVLNALPDR